MTAKIEAIAGSVPESSRYLHHCPDIVCALVIDVCCRVLKGAADSKAHAESGDSVILRPVRDGPAAFMQVEAMLDRGIYRMEDYVEGGWVTGLKYEDELITDLEKRTGSNPDKLKSVEFLWPLHMGLTTQQEELDRYADKYRLGSSHHGHSTWVVLCKGRCYRSSIMSPGTRADIQSITSFITCYSWSAGGLEEVCLSVP